MNGKISVLLLFLLLTPGFSYQNLHFTRQNGFPGDDKKDSCRILIPDSFHHYANYFIRNDQETVKNYIPNDDSWNWMVQNIPFFECPDKEIEETYYFRWWTYRKHIRQTPGGFVITEFLPDVGWSKKYNSINGAVGHHLYEGRWIHDPRFLDGCIRFYFSKEGDPGGISKVYSSWIADGIYARYLVNQEKAFVSGILDDLIRNYEAWNHDGQPGNKWQLSRLLDNGLYWQIDSWEATEFSIGGTGIRPPINSYMYGDAFSISRMAGLSGKKELVLSYLEKAEKLRQLVQDSLWDSREKFFKVLRNEKVPTGQYNNTAAEKCKPGKLVSVREIFGYVPWYFNLPKKGRGYEIAWKQLTDPQGFLAPFGPTVAERRHPNFRINSRGCEWCGASWPFATSQTLTALANLLNNYKQDTMGRDDFFNLMKTYTNCHRKKLENGQTIPWIDESINPDTGEWIPTEGDPPRGRDYNHSTYCDLVITGLAGLRPQENDTIVINPLIPEGKWDYFCLDNLLYHGQILTILYDKTGKHYGKGKGLLVFKNGKIIARSKSLKRVTGTL